MNSTDKKNILQRYRRLYQEHGYHHRALGWNDERHFLRYEILLSHWDLTDKSILDFGCGFGDMYGFIQKQAIRARYNGVDLNPELIAQGRRVYPKAKLQDRDVFKQGLPRTYDYIFSSGMHNFKIKDNMGFIEQTFKVMDRYAKKGFALNFLSDQVDYRLDHAHHSNPTEILKLAYRHSRRVTLRNDYMPFEFTVFIDKQVAFDKAYPVYRDFKSTRMEVVS